MAAGTGERVTDPAWQGNPVEAAIPGWEARTSVPTRSTKFTFA